MEVENAMTASSRYNQVDKEKGVSQQYRDRFYRKGQIPLLEWFRKKKKPQ